jgi:aspartate racemase
MKTIGLLGGMSWESMVPYYRIINETVGERLGGLHSARVVLYSVEFQEIEMLQHADRWEETAEILTAAARSIEAGGADFLVICTNTMHKVAPQIEEGIGIPMLHIADATADEIKAAGMRAVGLLGTKFTMEHDFYRGRLERNFGLEVVVPDAAGRDAVHRVIYEELCLGSVRDDSRQVYREIIEDLVARGAEAIILGCTEIAMLVGPEDSTVPVFDTTEIHARKAVDWALED